VRDGLIIDQIIIATNPRNY